MNTTLTLIYRLLQKAITANTQATACGYIADAMDLIEKYFKQNA